MARNHTPKPLYGAKKYSLIPQACTVSGCETEFFVSYGTTPAKRRCEEHHFNEPVSDTQKALDILKSLC